MSAYMVEDKTINKIVAGIEYCVKHGDGSRFPTFQQSYLIAFGLTNVNRESLEKLGHILFDMNIESINQRYGEGEAETFRPLDYQYHVEPPPLAVHLYKALQCFTYQCYEGDVPETTIYKTLEEFIRDLAQHIVYQLPDYNKAPWG